MKQQTLIFLFSVLILPIFIGCKKNCDQSERCELEPDPGVCEGYFPKYYFDQETGSCQEFIWGGCEGTVPFETLEDCEACECNE